MTTYRRNYPTASKLIERMEHTLSCWFWTAGKDRCGYGRIWHNGENRTAHTVAYETWVLPIPKGMHVLHTCDNPSCINPAHLWLGTHEDNMADKAAKKRYPPHGPNGKFMSKIKTP